MRQWLVTLEKKHTAKDLLSGVKGKCSMKTAIFESKKKDIKGKIKLEDNQEIVSIQDWNELQRQQVARNIKWLFAV